uniref:Uncharacterized protein n=1 Tax=Lactuca sativa TaxID=4236 RepID=A0A9R1URC5_LACSA|nr:hypothetical protein LSAT_V11C800440350 [Lactuca sativa]
MGILMPRITQAKQILKRSFSNGSSTTKSMDIPKGCLAVYIGEQEKKRFVVPIWLLMQPTFQQLLDQAEEEFGNRTAEGSGHNRHIEQEQAHKSWDEFDEGGYCGDRVPRFAKMEFPVYEGKDDPLEWSHKCEDFFEEQQTPPEAWVYQATFAL